MLNMKNFIDTGLILWAFIQRQLEKIVKMFEPMGKKTLILSWCIVYFIQSFIACIYTINSQELVFCDIFTFDILNNKPLEYLNFEL